MSPEERKIYSKGYSAGVRKGAANASSAVRMVKQLEKESMKHKEDYFNFFRMVWEGEKCVEMLRAMAEAEPHFVKLISLEIGFK